MPFRDIDFVVGWREQGKPPDVPSGHSVQVVCIEHDNTMQSIRVASLFERALSRRPQLLRLQSVGDGRMNESGALEE